MCQDGTTFALGNQYPWPGIVHLSHAVFCAQPCPLAMLLEASALTR